jgi:hypothetical protein
MREDRCGVWPGLSPTNGFETSCAAAESIQKYVPRLHPIILDEMRRAGSHGVTCDELEVTLGLRHQTASARLRELALGGRVVDSEHRRQTRSGRAAIVWWQR